MERRRLWGRSDAVSLLRDGTNQQQQSRSRAVAKAASRANSGVSLEINDQRSRSMINDHPMIPALLFSLPPTLRPLSHGAARGQAFSETSCC
jgi:hypothetical protein